MSPIRSCLLSRPRTIRTRPAGMPAAASRFVSHLPVGGAGGVQTAGPGVRHMGLDGGQLQMLHKGAQRLPAALQLKGHHTAGAVGQVLLCQGMVLVPWQAAVADGGHLGMCRQELRHRLAVLTVAGHAHMEALQPQVQIEGVLGDWMAPKSRISWAVHLVMKAPSLPNFSA